MYLFQKSSSTSSKKSQQSLSGMFTQSNGSSANLKKRLIVQKDESNMNQLGCPTAGRRTVLINNLFPFYKCQVSLVKWLFIAINQFLPTWQFSNMLRPQILTQLGILAVVILCSELSGLQGATQSCATHLCSQSGKSHNFQTGTVLKGRVVPFQQHLCNL